MRLRYKDVVVQKLYTSKRARKYYRYARQRKPIGSIDLRGVSTMDALGRVWKEEVGKNGTFSLLARDTHGNLAKCIGTITVDRGVVGFKDRRCTLCVHMRARRRRRQAIKQDDFVLTGR